MSLNALARRAIDQIFQFAPESALPCVCHDWRTMFNISLKNEVEKLPVEMSDFYLRAFEVLPAKGVGNHYLVYRRLHELLFPILEDLDSRQLKEIRTAFNGSFSISRFVRMHAEISSLNLLLRIWDRVRSVFPYVTTPVNVRDICILLTHLDNASMRADLQELNLKRMQLRSFPSALLHFPNVVHLNLSYNRLTTLPAEIANFTALRTLNIEGNPLDAAQFQAIIKLCETFHSLESVVTEYEELSEGFSQIIYRRYEAYALLVIWAFLRTDDFDLPLLTDPEAIRKALREPNPVFARVTDLKLHYFKLRVFPGEFACLRNLNHLNLAHNHFTDLPEAVLQFKKLRSINLNDNPIRGKISPILDRLRALPQLETVHIGNIAFRFTPARRLPPATIEVPPSTGCGCAIL